MHLAKHTFQKMLLASLLAAILLQPGTLRGEPIAVRYTEGSIHGFLALRSPEGKTLAEGDLTQVIRGNRAFSRLVFRFRDGSIDDETSTFSQHGNFRLIRDHHIQKGPIFPKSTDVLIDAVSGQVTVRYKDKGVGKVETDHLDLPPDLANGIILDLIKNIAPNVKETKLSYVAATPKPRLVQLLIMPAAEDTFSVAGRRQKAMRFKIKVELGGFAGMIAPLVGKQPADFSFWVVGGGAPAFVKEEGPLYLGGPIWGIEMTSPIWPPASESEYKKH